MSDDTISRQSAIDVLHGYFDGMLETDTICPKDLYNLFEVLPSAQPEVTEEEVKEYCRKRCLCIVDSALLKKYASAQQWIPCSERLPKEKDAGILKKLGTEKRSEYVLATVEVKGERMTVTACTYDGKWDWNMKYAFPDFKVIAWMPLPEPYKSESEG